MGILEVENLTLELGGKRVLDGLTIDFWEGHIHALIGPNGAGKSTFASAIMGLAGYRHIGGDIRFEGESIKGLSVDERARLGLTLAWQEPARYQGLGVRQFIQAGAKDKSLDAVKKALRLVDLDPATYMYRAVDRTLSGGERKRVELASILAMDPKVVMMDEPDSGIDVAALDHIFAALKRLKGKGTTVILITHSQTVLEQADHGFLICSGKLVDKGSVDKIAHYIKDKCIPCGHKNEPELGEVP
ncbi:MAG TPA: ABC transporter ATP-binding protein [Candidatus Hydrogenedentes bacterium]|nr:ABC transporter ATP-binding protein [Candidatus Hydrogenedentota bacterium]HPG67694.1 ABC transporter ATP-binding protein [Candidatus Hydrogenedentota bacterium]